MKPVVRYCGFCDAAYDAAKGHGCAGGTVRPTIGSGLWTLRPKAESKGNPAPLPANVHPTHTGGAPVGVVGAEREAMPVDDKERVALVLQRCVELLKQFPEDDWPSIQRKLRERLAVDGYRVGVVRAGVRVGGSGEG